MKDYRALLGNGIDLGDYSMPDPEQFRSQFQESIDMISSYIFVDPEVKHVANSKVSHWNVTMLALTYMLDSNALILGEPGTGKTTAAKVIGSMMSGYPFDLYGSAQIQGHPDQTYETMIARLDFGAQARGIEEVIWLSAAYLPVRIIDEINRLPEGNQSELLNALATGRFNYLNASFYRGNTSCFATENHADAGNTPLIPPMRDRFGICVELGDIGATYDIALEDARDNIQMLRAPHITTRILSIINEKGKSIEEKLRLMDQERQIYIEWLGSKEFGVRIFNARDRQAFQKMIRQVPFTDEANVMRRMIHSELNMTARYGRKRSSDKPDTSNHAEKLASTNVKNAGSLRGVVYAMRDYSRALAWLGGESVVTKDHIIALAPYILGHRLQFSDKFEADYIDRRRIPAVSAADGSDKHLSHFGMPKEMFLALNLALGVEQNYEAAKTDIDLLMKGAQASGLYDEQGIELHAHERDDLREMEENPESLDHPLAKELLRRLVEDRQKRQNT